MADISEQQVPQSGTPAGKVSCAQACAALTGAFGRTRYRGCSGRYGLSSSTQARPALTGAFGCSSARVARRWGGRASAAKSKPSAPDPGATAPTSPCRPRPAQGRCRPHHCGPGRRGPRRRAAAVSRVRRQTTELQPLAAELLDRVGAAEGQSAIDVGCGPRGILELLAERVGPRVRVVGLEVDPVHVAMARELVAERGLTNVEVIQADARNTGLPPASFDVAHARTVLVNVPDPEAVLAEMTRLVRAGGWVASLEPDVAVDLYHRANPAWDRLHQIFITAVQAVGADPFIGRRLPELFREAGLSDIGVRAHAELYPTGHTRRTIRLDLVRSMRPKIMALGIASEQELDDLDRAAREHLDDPHTLVLPHLFFLVWGRKPTT